MSTRALEFALMVTFLVIAGTILILVIGPQVLGGFGLLGGRLAARLALKPASHLLGRLPVRRVRAVLGHAR